MENDVATVTPMEIARGYASFANGGYLINPFLIARIEDQNGAIVEYANRKMICPDCPAPKTKTGSNQNRTVDRIRPTDAYQNVNQLGLERDQG